MIEGMQRPIILCVSGHDPTGGAGIQADIETVTALGGHAATAITCLTVQDTANIRELAPTDEALLTRQLDVLTRDLPVSAVKIGLLGTAGIARLVERVVASLEVAVVLDPVLQAGGGAVLADESLIDAIAQFLPRVTLITPNRQEAIRLAYNSDAAQAARQLARRGPAVLLTGADEAQGQQVTNLLYQGERPPREYRQTRLPHTYHGSGCTLASACAVYLARGYAIELAVGEAQRFTQEALRKASALGHGQWLPRRS
jgi:hydroxymethylpyrimidine/phosphomethylpyrimidine kinase